MKGPQGRLDREMRNLTLSVAAAMIALGSGLPIAGALAQSAMPAVDVPPPPSAKDRIGRDGASVGEAKPRRTKKPARAAATGEDQARRPLRTPPSPTASSIDNRVQPARPQMELEDDPRDVRPIMQNGRPGVGVRF